MQGERIYWLKHERLILTMLAFIYGTVGVHTRQSLCVVGVIRNANLCVFQGFLLENLVDARTLTHTDNTCLVSLAAVRCTENDRFDPAQPNATCSSYAMCGVYHVFDVFDCALCVAGDGRVSALCHAGLTQGGGGRDGNHRS